MWLSLQTSRKTKRVAQPPMPFVLGAEFSGVISPDSPIPKNCPYKAGGESCALLYKMSIDAQIECLGLRRELMESSSLPTP